MTDIKENDVVQRQDNSPDTRSVPAQQQPTSNSIDNPVVLDVSPASTGAETSSASGTSDASDASDASGKCETSSEVNALSAGGLDHSESTDQEKAADTNLPTCIPTGVSVFMGGDGNAYIDIGGESNAIALPIGGKAANRVLQEFAQQQMGTRLKAYELREINEELTAHAELSGDVRDVYYRCAPFENGIELDIGDDRRTRIRIKPGKVVTIHKGSKTLFRRTPTMRSLPMPADVGDLKLLNKYLNLHPTHVLLLLGYLSYTLAHPNVSTTNFVILVLQGDQGSGKSFLCKIIQNLIDPNLVGVQTFAHNQKDLVIASMNAHVLFYDNMRNISPAMADKLCIASSGGHLTGRQLYTDAEQQIHRLHVALVLNGIHSFIDQPDLAQRSLPLHLLSIDEKDRRSETELYRKFQTDLPMIFRGLLDLIADIMKHLPTVEATNPERMIDFSRWLTAMEMVDGVPPEVYQTEYSDVLNEGMLDSLMDNPLASTVMSFITNGHRNTWSGRPSELLHELNSLVGNRSRYSREWPQTASALSKRLKPLQASLKRQGIEIHFERGKHRTITITNLEAF